MQGMGIFISLWQEVRGSRFHEAVGSDKRGDGLIALSVGGTATGEHGVAWASGSFMMKEHGESLRLMRQIKQLLDPNGILNPGKIFQRRAKNISAH